MNKKNYHSKNNTLVLPKPLNNKTMKLISLDLIHLNYPFITTEMKWTKDDIQFFMTINFY